MNNEKDLINEKSSDISFIDKLLKLIKQKGRELGVYLLEICQEESKTPDNNDSSYHNNAATGTSSNELESVGNKNDLKDSLSDDNTTQQQEDKQNVSCNKLVKELVKMIDFYDRLSENSTDEATHNIFSEVANRLITTLILAGCSPINPEEGDCFDPSLHRTIPYSILIDNKHIKQTIRMGVKKDDEILVTAIVKIKENNNEIL